mgnify:CR=1 FL=1
MTDAQFAQASDFLRKVHENMRMYWTGNTELSQAMASGEVDIARAWNETVTTLKADGADAAINKGTEEELSTWVCGYTRLASGKSDEDLVCDYLNAVSDPHEPPLTWSRPISKRRLRPSPPAIRRTASTTCCPGTSGRQAEIDVLSSRRLRKFC